MEAAITALIAVIGGGAALNNRLHNRINNVHDRISGLDRRIDAIELNVAQDYVSKADLSVMVQRMEDHAFEPGKKLKISSNYTFDFQRRETVVYWDYFLNNTGKNVIFQNLGETYEHNMSSGISKLAFPLK